MFVVRQMPCLASIYILPFQHRSTGCEQDSGEGKLSMCTGCCTGVHGLLGGQEVVLPHSLLSELAAPAVRLAHARTGTLLNCSGACTYHAEAQELAGVCMELREMIHDSGIMQVLKRVRMRMQRTVRVLYMIHCTFRDGFQVSCS
jgi:hypothetical protein